MARGRQNRREQPLINVQIITVLSMSILMLQLLVQEEKQVAHPLFTCFTYLGFQGLKTKKNKSSSFAALRSGSTVSDKNTQKMAKKVTEKKKEIARGNDFL